MTATKLKIGLPGVCEEIRFSIPLHGKVYVLPLNGAEHYDVEMIGEYLTYEEGHRIYEAFSEDKRFCTQKNISPC